MRSLSSHPRTACPYLKLTFKTVQGQASELRVPGPAACLQHNRRNNQNLQERIGRFQSRIIWIVWQVYVKKIQILYKCLENV